MTARASCIMTLLTLFALSGCGKAPPTITGVSGVLLIDGQPLPQAKIEFVPDLPNHGAETNSSAVTDDQGRFTLTNVFTLQPGAVVGRHHVLVTEMPTPSEFRSPSAEVQARYAQHLAKLKNRPIPASFGVLANALMVEVTAEPKEYRIELTRKQ
jgi:hypothetical protein